MIFCSLNAPRQTKTSLVLLMDSILFMKYVGIDCGQFRSPVINMSANSYEEFVKDVQSLIMQDLFSVL